jgi:Protein of unknown function (DUF3800)
VLYRLELRSEARSQQGTGTLQPVTSGSLFAYIDEAGQRAWTSKSSDHFVMSAVVIADSDLGLPTALLAQLRQDLRRNPGDTLHWRNFKNHADKVHASRQLGGAPWVTISSVVVCKRQLAQSAGMTEDMAYLYTFRFLLERLSWLARDSDRTLDYTLAHVVRFKLATLRNYEARLRALPASQCKVAWSSVNPRGGHLDQPSRLENLQLADLAASATFAAFEKDRHGNTEPRYLQELSPRLYRRLNSSLTSYGLKMHPWDANTRAAYPWVAAL